MIEHEIVTVQRSTSDVKRIKALKRLILTNEVFKTDQLQDIVNSFYYITNSDIRLLCFKVLEKYILKEEKIKRLYEIAAANEKEDKKIRQYARKSLEKLELRTRMFDVKPNPAKRFIEKEEEKKDDGMVAKHSS